LPKTETNIAGLAEMMVGHRMDAICRRTTRPSEKALLEIDGLSLVSRKGQCLLGGVSFCVRGGEIFGICGVEGNGQTELYEVLVGLRAPTRGRILLAGRDVTHLSTQQRLALGFAHIPPDRIRMGLVGEMSIRENLILGRHRDPKFAGSVFLKTGEIDRQTLDLVRNFRIEPSDPAMRADLLSGGNQQKTVAARELSRDPEFVVASQPTRGLDIGASRLIHELLLRLAEDGKGVLLISADLSEIMMLSDRIGVMYRGSLGGVVERSAASEENLGLLMAGAKPSGKV
jgi:simple sugar transport system ATP-binding protein